MRGDRRHPCIIEMNVSQLWVNHDDECTIPAPCWPSLAGALITESLVTYFFKFKAKGGGAEDRRQISMQN